MKKTSKALQEAQKLTTVEDLQAALADVTVSSRKYFKLWKEESNKNQKLWRIQSESEQNKYKMEQLTKENKELKATIKDVNVIQRLKEENRNLKTQVEEFEQLGNEMSSVMDTHGSRFMHGKGWRKED